MKLLKKYDFKVVFVRLVVVDVVVVVVVVFVVVVVVVAVVAIVVVVVPGVVSLYRGILIAELNLGYFVTCFLCLTTDGGVGGGGNSEKLFWFSTCSSEVSQ